MDGSSDPHYRYTMPAIVVKHEGKGKMKKSVLVNIKEVCESIGRPADYLVTYLGQKLNASAKMEKDLALSYVTGHQDLRHVQAHVLKFIQDAVMCRQCCNPETSCRMEGSKKRQVSYLHCKSCGKRSDLDSTDRFVKYMISHADDVGERHSIVVNATNATAQTIGKKECPQCHHKTSKSTCSKCGAAVGAETFAGEKMDAVAEKSIDVEQPSQDESKKLQRRKECPVCHHKTSKLVCSKCRSSVKEKCDIDSQPEVIMDQADDLLNCVRCWVTSSEASHDDLNFDDFMTHMTKHGFPKLAPLDYLERLARVVSCMVSKDFTKANTRLQPIDVAHVATPIAEKCSTLIEQLFGLAGDASAAIDVVIKSVTESVAVALPAERFEEKGDCVILGLLIGLKSISCISDGLLQGCRRIEGRTAAWDKFMDFLEEEEDEDEEEEEESEDKEETDDDDHDEGDKLNQKSL